MARLFALFGLLAALMVALASASDSLVADPHRIVRRHHKHHHKSHHRSTSGSAIKGQPVGKKLAEFTKKAFAASKCEHQLDTQRGGGFIDGGGFKNQHYCGSSAKDPEYVWWTSNADVDCDGTHNCAGNTDGQSQTAATVDGKFLDALTTPYVVINQQGSFDFTRFGINLMNAVTVVCNGKQFGAVIGDTNGNSQIGEMSVFLAKNCFPKDHISGNNAAPNEVLYLVHTGNKAVVDSTSPSAIAAHAAALTEKLSF